MGDRTSLILALMLGLIVLSVVDGATGTSKVVNASEILAKIQNGEQIEYNGVTIIGDLDLSKLDLPTIHVNRTYIESIEGVPSEVKVVASPLDITKSQINGNVTFNNGYFISPIIVFNAIFLT